MLVRVEIMAPMPTRNYIRSAISAATAAIAGVNVSRVTTTLIQLPPPTNSSPPAPVTGVGRRQLNHLGTTGTGGPLGPSTGLPMGGTRIEVSIVAVSSAEAASLLSTLAPTFNDMTATVTALGFAVTSTAVRQVNAAVQARPPPRAPQRPFRPPLPSPSSPPSASAAFVTMAVVVTGSESDFTPTVRLDLRSAVASEARVDVSAVRLVVAAVARLRELRRELQGSSVTLTFTIVTSAAAAAATVNALSSRLANPTAASAFLSTPSLTVIVTSITLPVATYMSPPSPPTATESIVGTIAIAVVVPIGALCLIGVVWFYYFRFRRRNPDKVDPAYTQARHEPPRSAPHTC
jgi:hypothetical protein